MRKFLASVRDDRLYAAWLLLATTGVRRGELLGLRWEDLDLERAKLSVRRAVTVVRGEPVATEPKTAKGRRTLSLDPATLAALCAHLQRQREERIAAGPARQEFGLVFCRADGSAFNPEAVSRHFSTAWQPWVSPTSASTVFATATPPPRSPPAYQRRW